MWWNAVITVWPLLWRQEEAFPCQAEPLGLDTCFWFVRSLAGTRPHTATLPSLKGHTVVCLCHNNTIYTPLGAARWERGEREWWRSTAVGRDRETDYVRTYIQVLWMWWSESKLCGLGRCVRQNICVCVCVCVWSCSRQHSWLHMRAQSPSQLPQG